MDDADAQNPPHSRSMDEEFRRRCVIPEYLRLPMASAVSSHQIPRLDDISAPPNVTAPSHPVIVMINSKSGGRKGPFLHSALNELLSEEQVYDLLTTPPNHFFRYGLGCLERLAENGDVCAKETRNNIRVIVAGGDGTVGWVLGSLAELHAEQRTPVPPVGIIPLGTGNDLARSFGWGGSFPWFWNSAVKKYLLRAGGDATCKLDSWQVVMKTIPNLEVAFPHALHPQHHIPPSDEGEDPKSQNDDNVASFEGVFYNYFSIGMDAEVAFGFHNLREKRPQIAQGPISNKLIYSGCSCVQGWFCTPCSADPRARGLRYIMRLHVKKSSSSNWQPVDIPPNVRSVVLLNLQSYASGRNPWGHPSPEYNAQNGFVQPKADDGLLEIFGLFDGWHASLVMLNLHSANRLAQGSAVRLQLVADKRQRVYMQMDGEPWRQPLLENSTTIEITRVPTASIMLKGS